MQEPYSAWNPGLESDIPTEWRTLESIHRPENVSSSLADIDEIANQTGLNHKDLVIFRPERLALHELIIRITADIMVLEGSDEVELGKNFRHIVKRVFACYIAPHLDELNADYWRLRQQIRQRIDLEILTVLFPQQPEKPKDRCLFGIRLRHNGTKKSATYPSTQVREHNALATFKAKGLAASDPLSSAIFRNLYRVLGSLAGNRGYLGPDPGFLGELVCNQVCNAYGSEYIGRKIAPWIDHAIDKEAYTRVANAPEPLLISLKGASAAGKSSLRPMLRKMMSDRGIQPGSYAIISPDIWRRLLLDYESLGAAYKYAGRLTSQEVIIIDSKLDHYIREKADRMGAMPHLLVDRFRFDSFSTERIATILHATYVKHIHTLTMYFVVTPPHVTVERGWERGVQTGRYKALEDFLDHSVEAYRGMPKILFKWLAYDQPLFHYAFLDNSVPKGSYPRTIAFGTQQEMNIVNCTSFIDIERYQKINIRARCPEQVYPSGSTMSVENNIGFLTQCLRKIPRINFLDAVNGTTYLQLEHGIFRILNHRIMQAKLKEQDNAIIFQLIAPGLVDREFQIQSPPASQRI
ncbi:MAG: hypothetical protein KDI27_09490 [Gammaproteobacteria bacterium]|nr:hypothetical protein [Gammaproteobacteria bacterium]MCP5416567.1 hypothetical protein [Chromatiaceae bacterium]